MSDAPQDDPERKPRSLPELPGAAAFLSMGTTVGACVGVGVVLGVLADDEWHVSPWGLLIGLGLGVLVGVLSVIRLVQRWL